MFSGYYRQDQVEEPSTISKIVGFGIFAGIAVAAAGPAFKSTGGKSLLKNLYTLAGNAQLDKVEGSVVKNEFSHAVKYFSGEGQSFLSGLLGVSKAIVSEYGFASRADPWLDHVEKSVTKDSLESFKSIRGALKSHLIGPLKATNMETAVSLALDTEWLDGFREITHGIQFNEDSREGLANIINHATRSSWENVNRRGIMSVMGNDTSRRYLLDSIERGALQRRKRYELFDRVLPSGMKEIKFGELVDDQNQVTEVGQRLNKWAETHLGFKKGEDDFVTRTMKHFQKGLTDTFGDGHKNLGNITDGQRQDIEDHTKRFLEAHTGFVMDESGKIIPKAKVGQGIAERYSKIYSQLSLPLLPGVFHVQLGKLFNFAKADESFVRNLGRAISQPELLKAGYKFGSNSSLIKVGEEVLHLDTTQDKLEVLKGRYHSMPVRMSTQAANMQRIRGEHPLSMTERASQVLLTKGHVAKIKEALAGDEENVSIYRQWLRNTQHQWSDVATDGEGKIIVTPKKIASELGIDKALLVSLHSDPSNVSLGDLNAISLQRLQKDIRVQNSPYLKSEIAFRLSQIGGGNEVDLIDLLKHQKDLLKGSHSINNKLYKALDKTNKAQDLFSALEEVGMFNDQAAEELKAYPHLFEAIESAKSDYRTMTDTKSEGIITHVLGESAPTALNIKVQNAILDQIMEAHGVRALEEQGISKQVFHQLAHEVRGNIGPTQDTDALRALIQKTFNLDSKQSEDRFIDGLVSNLFPSQEGGLREDRFGNLARLFVDPSKIKTQKELSDQMKGRIIFSKVRAVKTFEDEILGNFHPSSVSVTEQVKGDSKNGNIYRSLANLQEQMSQHSDMAKAIRKRGNLSIKTPNLTETAGSHFFLVNKELDPMSLIENPKGALGSIANASFNTMGGLIDTSQPLNYTSYVMNILGQMSDRLGSEVGLGVGVQDKQNALRYLQGVGLKRVLPIIVGYEAYKNINKEADDRGVPGIDDMYANARANFGLASSRFGDFSGLTNLLKYSVDSIPGLDAYITPRSHAEYSEYLNYGYEYTREGQGWLIGNKGFFRGGRITSAKPNFYRRGVSGWMGASNVDMANTEYSFLPSLSHPFAPINLMLHPHWFQEKHKYDRPYIPNDLGSGMGTKQGFYGALYNDEQGEGNGEGVGGDKGYGSGGGRGPGGGGLGGSIYGNINIAPDNILDKGVEYINRYREQAGLYGGLIRALPLWPDNSLGRQDVGQARDFRRVLMGNGYGELLGPYGEYARRILGGDDSSKFAYSPYKNDQPTWLSDPQLHMGDPYTRIHNGEMLLPGEAFSRLNPWSHPLKARGSMIGDGVNEIIEKMLDPVDGEAPNSYMEFGTDSHKRIQNQLKEMGMLIAAEVPIYNSEYNISGTLDAVVNGATGREIIDIKTQNAKDFELGKVASKYEDQLNFYLMTTDLQKGYLAFVNSSDPSQVRFTEVYRDPERFERTVQRLEEARDKIREMIHNHEISPYETYDVLSRIAVLSKVEPHSKELDRLFEFVEQGGGGFNAQEKLIYDRIRRDTHEMRKHYRTYSYRSAKTQLKYARVLSVNNDGTITTEAGTIKLAGIEFDRQAFNAASPTEILANYGVKEGKNLLFNVNAGLSPDVMKDITVSAIVGAGIHGSINQNLVKDKYANLLNQSDDPIDHIVMGGQRGLFRNSLEWVMHRDTILNNKLFRVRSPLEQLERGEAYGTDAFDWKHPIKTLVSPLITSMIAKDPLTSGLQTGIGVSLLFRDKGLRLKAGLFSAGIMALLSTVRQTYEFTTGNKWVAPRYRKQQEIDEYYDTLSFVKSASEAESIRQKAYDMGYDLDKNPNMAPSQIRKTYDKAVERAQSTMYAFDTVKGSLDQALKIIPFRHRQLAEETILYANSGDKQKFYKLLSSPEQRVLGKFLGIKNTTDRPTLGDYFSKHFLPGPEWAGWKYDEDLSMYERATAQAAGTLSENMTVEDRAKVKVSHGIRIPRVNGMYMGFVRESLHSIQDQIDTPVLVNSQSYPSLANNVTVNFDIRLSTKEGREYGIRKDLRRA